MKKSAMKKITSFFDKLDGIVLEEIRNGLLDSADVRNSEEKKFIEIAILDSVQKNMARAEGEIERKIKRLLSESDKHPSDLQEIKKDTKKNIARVFINFSNEWEDSGYDIIDQLDWRSVDLSSLSDQEQDVLDSAMSDALTFGVSQAGKEFNKLISKMKTESNQSVVSREQISEKIKVTISPLERKMISQFKEVIDESTDIGREWGKLALYIYEQDNGKNLFVKTSVGGYQDTIYEWCEQFGKENGYKFDYDSRDSLYKQVMEETKDWSTPDQVNEDLFGGMLTLLSAVGIGIPLTQLFIYGLDKYIMSGPKLHSRIWDEDWEATKKKYKDLAMKIKKSPEWKKLQKDQEFMNALSSSVSGQAYKRGGRADIKDHIERVLGAQGAKEIEYFLDRARDVAVEAKNKARNK